MADEIGIEPTYSCLTDKRITLMLLVSIGTLYETRTHNLLLKRELL